MSLKQKNRMDNVQVLKLGDYIRTGGESLFVNKTLIEVAEEATAKLGFNIAPSAVSALADSLNIRRRRKSPDSGAASRGSNVVVIAKALAALYNEFNLPPPADLSAIISHRKAGEGA